MMNPTDRRASEASTEPQDKDGHADPGLQDNVDRSVPDQEKLPDRAGENPISQQVKETIERRTPKPGSATFKGGDKVER